MFHDSFYLKLDLEDAKISEEMRQKLQIQDYDDIVSKHNSDIGLTHLEEMTTETDPKLPS